MEVKDKFLNIFNGLKDKLTEFITRLKNGLSSFMGSRLDTVKKFIEDRVNNIVNIKDYIFNKVKEIWVRTVFRILIQLYVSIKMKENESKSKQN